MKSLSKPNVYKSTNVILGDKKELVVNLVQPINIIKGNNEPVQEEPLEGEDQEVDMETLREEARAIIDEAEAEKERLLQQAKEEAQSIIDEAYEDSKGIFEDARQKGYSEGLISGKEQGYQEVDSIIQESVEIKKQTFEEKKIAAKDLEEDLIALVIQGVKKVLHHEIDQNHELLLNLIQSGIEKCTFAESLIIKVGEGDYEVVKGAKNKIYMMTKGIENLEIKCDPALSKGSVMIETLSGTIDSSIDAQVKTVEKLFNELLRSE